MWDKIKYFKKEEFDDPLFPGSGENINFLTVKFLDKLRENTGWPIVVHCWVGGAVDMHGNHGHSSNSFHLYKNGCKAVDFHFRTNASIQRQIKEVLKSDFTGIGVYYDWGVPVGFHVDTRPVSRYQIWKRDKDRYIYLVQH